MKKILIIALSLSIMMSVSAVGTFANHLATAETTAAERKVMPTVVVIRADWCTACQQLEPTMMGLMKEYMGKINFVVLDVTNDTTTAEAMAKANSLGLGKFFQANKKMTSTVGVFKGKKQTFKTMKNMDREAYVMAFEKALK